MVCLLLNNNYFMLSFLDYYLYYRCTGVDLEMVNEGRGLNNLEKYNFSIYRIMDKYNNIIINILFIF